MPSNLEIRASLSVCVTDPPEDLIALYAQGDLPREPSLGIHVLDLPAAVQYTQAVQRQTLIGNRLGLFVLEDANDSNPYCYVTRGLLRGSILHLRHDDNSSIEFASLAALLASLRAAIRNGTSIHDLADKELRPPVPQDQLAQHFMDLLHENSDESEWELVTLAPLLETAQREVVERMSNHESFFVREAAAQLIANQPDPSLQGLAEQLARDSYPQVARPAQQALAAIARLRDRI